MILVSNRQYDCFWNISMRNASKKPKIPNLRFPEFGGEWKEIQLSDICTFSKGKGISKADIIENGRTPCIRYAELYTAYGEVITNIISHTNVAEEELRLSLGGEILIPSSGESAKDIAKASALMCSDVAIGGDLNIIRTKENSKFIARSLSSVHKNDIAKLAQGNSIVHLYSEQLQFIKILLPEIKEQEKIADVFDAIDDRINILKNRYESLCKWKQGVTNSLFEQRIRFRNKGGKHFENWEEVRLGQVLVEHMKTSDGTERVFSVSVHKGLVDQIEHLGRSYAAENTEHYSRVQQWDIVYTKSPTGNFPYGIIKQHQQNENVIVSPLYGVFSPKSPAVGHILQEYFESSVATNNFLRPIVQRGAKNTMNISNADFLNAKLTFPVSDEEQNRIAEFLKFISRHVRLYKDQIQIMGDFKKALLKKMFV